MCEPRACQTATCTSGGAIGRRRSSEGGGCVYNNVNEGASCDLGDPNRCPTCVADYYGDLVCEDAACSGGKLQKV